MDQNKTIQLAINQLKAGEELRQQAIRSLEQQFTATPKKKGLTAEQKQRILARFYKNHVNQ
jgi:hypothetical protein